MKQSGRQRFERKYRKTLKMLARTCTELGPGHTLVLANDRNLKTGELAFLGLHFPDSTPKIGSAMQFLWEGHTAVSADFAYKPRKMSHAKAIAFLTNILANRADELQSRARKAKRILRLIAARKK